jgi:hypothetical protein
VERRVRAELRAAGWTATSVSPASTIGAIAVDLAQTQDRTKAARDKAALARELRIQLQSFRALSEPASKGDAVDEAADELPGGGAGAADPDRQRRQQRATVWATPPCGWLTGSARTSST